MQAYSELLPDFHTFLQNDCRVLGEVFDHFESKFKQFSRLKNLWKNFPILFSDHLSRQFREIGLKNLGKSLSVLPSNLRYCWIDFVLLLRQNVIFVISQSSLWSIYLRIQSLIIITLFGIYYGKIKERFFEYFSFFETIFQGG